MGAATNQPGVDLGAAMAHTEAAGAATHGHRAGGTGHAGTARTRPGSGHTTVGVRAAATIGSFASDSVPTALRQKVQGLEKQLGAQRKNLGKLEQTQANTEAAKDANYAKMGFREKYLFGWFGGDKSLVTNNKKFKAELKTIATGIDDQRDAIGTTDGAVRTALSTQLMKTDDGFVATKARFDQLDRIVGQAGRFRGAINRALSEIDDAQSAETFDMVSDSAAASLWSNSEASEAKSAINTVKYAATEFQATLKSYQDLVGSQSVGHAGFTDVGDGWDTFFDLAGGGGGFDFMSMFQLSALGDAESELRELRGKLSGVTTSIDGQRGKARAQLDTKIDTLRAACA